MPDPTYACIHGHEQREPGRCATCGEPVDRVRSALDLALGALDALRAEVAKDKRNGPLAEALRRAEERAIVEALVATDGVRAEAAKVVGMPLRTFMRKIPAHAPAAKSGPTDGEVAAALYAAGGNRVAAAKALGLHPRALQQWDAKTLTRKAKPTSR